MDFQTALRLLKARKEYLTENEREIKKLIKENEKLKRVNKRLKQKSD